MKRKTNKTEAEVPAYLHGECIIFRSTLPKDAVLEDHGAQPHVIIAESEVTGNHHVIEQRPGVRFYKSPTGVRFMENTVPTDVKCVIADRHTAIQLDPGVWELGFQQEFDYFTQSLQAVRD